MESLAYECQLLIPIIDPYDKIYLARLGVPNKFFKTFNKKEDFINGWLEDENAWGRPVSPFVMNDGSLLISDDKYNAIYRVQYNKDY